MTRKNAEQLLPVMEAYSKGKQVQYYDEGVEQWFDTINPSFVDGVKYRIKPESKYRSFNSKEECWNEMLKHEPFGWVTDGDSNYCISIIDGSIVMIGDYEEYTWSRSYKNALKALKFIDGTPFGIKE